MRILLIRFFALWLAVTPVYADSSFVAPSATGQAATGQVPGTTTNDNASAGNVGEYRLASSANTNGGQSGLTVTITIASPAVVTFTPASPYAFSGNATAIINFTTTGALPTGVVAGTNYYIIGSSVSGNNAQIATTADNALAGTAINTSGTQSGVHTGNPTAILATGTTVDVAAMSLSAGDWDVVSDMAFFANTTTSITLLRAGLNSAAATIVTIPNFLGQVSSPAIVPGISNTVLHVGPGRFSLSATTTVYCPVAATFTLSTLAAWGGCRARRVR